LYDRLHMLDQQLDELLTGKALRSGWIWTGGPPHWL
jgi:hypothetical protein